MYQVPTYGSFIVVLYLPNVIYCSATDYLCTEASVAFDTEGYLYYL